MAEFQEIRTALTAEIKTAREGVAFYTKRIAELERMLDNLAGLGIDATAIDHSESTQPRSSKKPKSNVASAKKRGRPAAVKAEVAEADQIEADDAKPAAKSGKKLPATNTAFWTSLMSATPMSNQEIMDAAVTSLKVRLSADDKKKLKQRLANFVTLASKDGSIVSEGTGRARRFSVRGSE